MGAGLRKQIYRFEILGEVARDGANAIYEARDTIDLSSVQLFEWIPHHGDDTLADKVAQVGSRIADVDVFMDQGGCYLAAVHSRAGEALEKLRDAGLFPGRWPGYFDAPVVSALSPPPPSLAEEGSTVNAGAIGSTEVPEIASPTPTGWIAATVLLALASLVFGGALISQSNSSNQRVSELNSKVSQLTSDLTATREAANSTTSELAKEKQATKDLQQTTKDLQQSAVNAIDSLYNRAASASAKRLTETLTIRNCGSTRLDVTVRYRGPLNTWVTQGWYLLDRGETRIFRASDPNFFIFSDDLKWPDSVESVEGTVVTNAFAHEDGQPVFGWNQHSVRMVKYRRTALLGCN